MLAKSHSPRGEQMFEYTVFMSIMLLLMAAPFLVRIGFVLFAKKPPTEKLPMESELDKVQACLENTACPPGHGDQDLRFPSIHRHNTRGATPLYYECHVTVEPIFDERLQQFQDICAKYNFRVAKLLMHKRKEDTPERSSKDAFCTGHSKCSFDLEIRMLRLMMDLHAAGFQVWRNKIEAILLDSKNKRSA